MQEFNLVNFNPVCQNKNYRKKVFEIFPKLKALDGHRESIPMIEFSTSDLGDEKMPEYNSKEEWFN